jgi:hypothetical protein
VDHFFNRLNLARLVVSELGLTQILLYGLYRLGLITGHYRRATPTQPETASGQATALRTDLIPLPARQELLEIVSPEALFQEAGEICSGLVRLFGSRPIPLTLEGESPHCHWSKIPPSSQDVKPSWEAGRFGWAVVLARAYYLSRDEKFARTFWQYTLAFLKANPANCGSHWSSAQEVALRLIALVFSAQIFAHSPHSSQENMQRLAQSIAEHAARIPPTLVYARAQHNNHLVSEAAGLYTAAAALPFHPQAPRWKRLGERWLNRALQAQITPDGAYIQHSTNYHRLMLQLALWVSAVQRRAFPGEPLAPLTLSRLKAASRWLWQLLDPTSGQVPNLGPNDGALILPLSSCPFKDFRPVLSAAAKTFIPEVSFPPGIWDEMPVWYGLKSARPVSKPAQSPDGETTLQHTNTLHGEHSWAYLRSAQFSSRPGHADQLHLDLWWRGLNIAQDAGTYLYTAPHPWDNALTHTAVHNTLMIDGQEQMRRAGRFLYLDWAYAEPPVVERSVDAAWQRLTAQHDGYRHLGITHQRMVTLSAADTWEIIDLLTGPNDGKIHTARLHWLLPDWEFQPAEHNEALGFRLRLRSPHGWITLSVSWPNSPALPGPQAFQWGLARAGQLVAGSGDVHPTWGWSSPTYAEKIPALAFYAIVNAALPIQLLSRWSFPNRVLLTD